MNGLSSVLPEEGEAASSEANVSKLIPQLLFEKSRAYLSFQLTPDNASFSNLELPIRCSFVLLDEKGRVRAEHLYSIESINDRFEIELPKLRAGSYNAWIKLQDKAYIRKYTAESDESSGWRMMLKKLGLPF